MSRGLGDVYKRQAVSTMRIFYFRQYAVGLVDTFIDITGDDHVVKRIAFKTDGLGLVYRRQDQITEALAQSLHTGSCMSLAVDIAAQTDIDARHQAGF